MPYNWNEQTWQYITATKVCTQECALRTNIPYCFFMQIRKYLRKPIPETINVDSQKRIQIGLECLQFNSGVCTSFYDL